MLPLLLLVLAADDRAEAAKAVLAAAKVSPYTTAETADLRVFATLPQATTNKLALAAQKAHAAAVTALKKDKSLWGGPLTVYVLTDAKQTRGLFTFGLKQAGDRQSSRIDVRAEPPAVVSGVSPGEKRTDAQVTADVTGLVASAVLVKVAGDGAELPGWLRSGFGRAVAARAEGPKALAALKAKVKGLAGKPGGLTPASLWDGSEPTDADTLAAGFADFLVFGPPADKFGRFLAALKPSEEVQEPTVATAMAAVEWKPEWLAEAFKGWVVSGGK